MFPNNGIFDTPLLIWVSFNIKNGAIGESFIKVSQIGWIILWQTITKKQVAGQTINDSKTDGWNISLAFKNDLKLLKKYICRKWGFDDIKLMEITWKQIP